MGKFITHYGLATWVVLGHQFKDNQIPFGCTYMRLVKSYLEFLSKMRILGASSNLKSLMFPDILGARKALRCFAEEGGNTK